MSQQQLTWEEAEQYQEALDSAVAEYRDRRNGKKPWGSWTHAGWFPAQGEACKCCASVYGPDRGGPSMAYLSHCRGAKHVAALFGVDEKDLRARVAPKKPSAPVDAYREGMDDAPAWMETYIAHSEAARVIRAAQGGAV